jgi:hypothetical protein
LALGVRTQNVSIMKNTVVTVYGKAEKFADFTITFIMKGNIRRAKKCLDVAELLFTTGSKETRNAIGNIYVHSVSTFMEMHHCTIAKLFPDTLRAEYVKQVNASGV